MKGINRADSNQYIFRLLSRFEAKVLDRKDENEKCIFISHKKEDTDECETVAQYLMNAGIDIYFDKYDKTIHQLVEEGNSDKITEHLQDGIDRSTHMLCVVSKQTISSYWVPFEVGYGFHHTDLGVLTLKGISDEELPEYMRIERVRLIRGTNSLNNYIGDLTEESKEVLETKELIQKNSNKQHPLDSVLDWEL